MADSAAFDSQVSEQDKRRAQDLYRANALRRAGSLGSQLDDYLQERQRKAILHAAKFAVAQRVIDVGAGLGYVARAAKSAGAHVTALDFVPETVQRLRGVVDEVIIADIEAFHSDKQYDRVLFIGVLDFIVRPGAAIQNVCRLVAPGGRLLVLVPTRTLVGQLYRFEKWLRGVRVNLFDPRWCVAVAQASGLHVESVSRPLPNNALMVFTRALHG